MCRQDPWDLPGSALFLLGQLGRYSTPRHRLLQVQTLAFGLAGTNRAFAINEQVVMHVSEAEHSCRIQSKRTSCRR